MFYLNLKYLLCFQQNNDEEHAGYFFKSTDIINQQKYTTYLI
jgi:hypothetical protein